MEWFKDLYDEFRMRRNFGSIPEEETGDEVDFMVDVLQLKELSKVLDLFCGVGRHTIELARRGYHACGVDSNAEYLSIAKISASMKNTSPAFIHGDVREVDFGSNYDAAIIMHCSFGYFSDDEDRLVLQKVHRSLKPGGKFLIELINRNWIISNFVKQSVDFVNGVKVEEQREYDSEQKRVRFTIKRYLADGEQSKRGSWRVYSPHDIKSVLRSVGFRYVIGYSTLGKKPLVGKSRLMRIVCEK
jgi:SAM-dependent methyltransferase